MTDFEFYDDVEGVKNQFEHLNYGVCWELKTMLDITNKKLKSINELLQVHPSIETCYIN